MLCYSFEENVLPSLAALQARLELSDSELKRIVLQTPAIVGMSIENNVLPTIDFLQRELSLSHSALRERIVGNPKMLSYSIERRLRPRVVAAGPPPAPAAARRQRRLERLAGERVGRRGPADARRRRPRLSNRSEGRGERRSRSTRMRAAACAVAIVSFCHRCTSGRSEYHASSIARASPTETPQSLDSPCTVLPYAIEKLSVFARRLSEP